jgi:hypothetical protein
MRIGGAWLLAVAVGCADSGTDTQGVTTTFPGPFATLSVATEGGRIELIAGSGDEVVVEFLPSSSDTWDSVEAEGNLSLVATCLGQEEAGCGGGFLVTVPADQQVTARTAAGQLAFTGALGGLLDGATASGGVVSDGLGPADLTLLTGTGEVDLAFAEAPAAVSIDTGSSPASLALPAGGYALDLDTGGALTVDPAIADDPSGPPLRVHSGTGDLTLTPAG